MLVAHLDGGYGAVLMANSDNGIRLISEILPAIARAWDWEGYAKKPLEPAAVSAEELDAVAGRYRVREDVVLEVARCKETGRNGTSRERGPSWSDCLSRQSNSQRPPAGRFSCR